MQNYQDAINLVIAINPILITEYLNLDIDLAYRPDARTEVDIILDTYAQASPVVIIPEVALKHYQTRYDSPVYFSVLDYMFNIKRPVAILEVAMALGITENYASECLHNLALINKLKKIDLSFYITKEINGQSYLIKILYTLPGYILTINDIPGGEIYDKAIAMFKKGYYKTEIAQYCQLSIGKIDYLIKYWPRKRKQLLKF